MENNNRTLRHKMQTPDSCYHNVYDEIHMLIIQLSKDMTVCYESLIHCIKCFDYSLLSHSHTNIRKISVVFVCFLIYKLNIEFPHNRKNKSWFINGPFLKTGRFIHLTFTPNKEEMRKLEELYEESSFLLKKRVIFNYCHTPSYKPSLKSLAQPSELPHDSSLIFTLKLNSILNSLSSPRFLDCLPDPNCTSIFIYLQDDVHYKISDIYYSPYPFDDDRYNRRSNVHQEDCNSCVSFQISNMVISLQKEIDKKITQFNYSGNEKLNLLLQIRNRDQQRLFGSNNNGYRNVSHAHGSRSVVLIEKDPRKRKKTYNLNFEEKSKNHKYSISLDLNNDNKLKRNEYVKKQVQNSPREPRERLKEQQMKRLSKIRNSYWGSMAKMRLNNTINMYFKMLSSTDDQRMNDKVCKGRYLTENLKKKAFPLVCGSYKELCKAFPRTDLSHTSVSSYVNGKSNIRAVSLLRHIVEFHEKKESQKYQNEYYNDMKQDRDSEMEEVYSFGRNGDCVIDSDEVIGQELVKKVQLEDRSDIDKNKGIIEPDNLVKIKKIGSNGSDASYHSPQRVSFSIMSKSVTVEGESFRKKENHPKFHDLNSGSEIKSKKVDSNKEIKGQPVKKRGFFLIKNTKILI